nr:hypothetical protein [uncultured Roseateles sp.]
MKMPAAALLSLLLGLTGLPSEAQDPGTVDKPNPRVGDSRIYVVLDSMTKVRQREEDTVVTAVSAEQIEVTERNQSVLSLYDQNLALLQTGERRFSPRVEPLQFPLAVGKRWTHSNSYDHASCGKTTTELRNQVVGWEEVKVPAGTFRALRIDSEGTWRNRCASDRSQYKFWYVPKVKWLVRSESWIYAGGRVFEGLIRELTEYQVTE